MKDYQKYLKESIDEGLADKWAPVKALLENANVDANFSLDRWEQADGTGSMAFELDGKQYVIITPKE